MLILLSACGRTEFDIVTRPGFTELGTGACARCDGDVLTSCDEDGGAITCLGGCNATPDPHCAPIDLTQADNPQLFRVSNIVPSYPLTQSPQVLSVESDAKWLIQSDTGEISFEGRVMRPAGAGLRNGIAYEKLSPSVAVLMLGGIDVKANAELRIYGEQALVLLSFGDVRVDGLIQVSGGLCADGKTALSCAGPGGGHGGDSSAAKGCAPGGAGEEKGDTGGGGGSLGTAGASGGAEADDGKSPGGSAGIIGTACVGATLVPLMGGSGGGRGGGSGGGMGGGGGGALQITAFGSITISASGQLNAAGAGGEGDEGGGGGGGSGGAILLESRRIQIQGTVAANGGGGGGGGASSSDGQTGLCGTAQAPGGGAASHKGGEGGSHAGAARRGGSASSDTGGGGGGMGHIRFNTAEQPADITTATLSPAPSNGKVPELK